MPASRHSSQSIDASFEMLVSQLNDSFPNADICERLALNRLRHALARQHELADITNEIHPAASADNEIRRAYSAADRDFWRALRYLQRRKSPSTSDPSRAAVLDITIAPANTALASTTTRRAIPRRRPRALPNKRSAPLAAAAHR